MKAIWTSTLTILVWLAAHQGDVRAQTAFTRPDANTTEGDKGDISDTNPSDTTMFVEVKPSSDTTADRIFRAQKMNGSTPVGPVRTIEPGNEFTFALAKGERVVAWDYDPDVGDTKDAQGTAKSSS